MRFPNYRQLDSRDCGPVCLQIICKYFGKYVDIERARRLMNTGREGSSVYDFIEAASSLEIKCLPYSISYWKFRHDVPLPCVILWRNSHFVVVYKITSRHIYVSDPAAGLCRYGLTEFANNWLSGDLGSNHTKRGICLTCEPTIRFQKQIEDRPSGGIYEAVGFFWQYMKPYKKQIAQITSVLLALSVVSAIFPILTQSIIDTGIPNQDTSFILLMLVAFISLSFGRTIGTWLHRSLGLQFAAKIKIKMTSDYLIRLFRMPMDYFETRIMGDIIQRNADFDRIETMGLSTIFSALLSILNLFVFGTILFVYNHSIFYVFLAGSALYVLWILVFWSFRKKMDIKYYSLTAKNQSQWIEFLSQISDIKGYCFSNRKRWAWEKNQVNLYKTRIKLLNVEQIQNLGSEAINSIKDALLIYLSSLSVINGNMTLGMLTSVQYILGQLSGPMDGIVNLIVSLQLSTISYGRVSDIQRMKAEDADAGEDCNDSLADYRSELRLSNVYFRYNGDSYALKNINITIPAGKTTAIVGESGCGKSTLLKLLSGLYNPSSGTVYIGGMKRSSIHVDSWRSHCGIITQDSMLSRDTIFNNIVFGRDPDDKKVIAAVEAANIRQDIEGLPKGYDTLIGENGRGVSEGQKQRILLARAIYGSPSYLFLDEMTSSLDVRNEESIVKTLKERCANKTICIVSHRKETIMNADMIIVLKNGVVVEAGAPNVLMNRKGEYYNLYNKGE